MVKDSERRLFDIVLVWKLDRFARDRYDAAHYKHILQRNHVKLVSATEPISDSPAGIMMESMLTGMAEYYSAELSEKIVRGMTENVLKGKYNGSTVCKNRHPSPICTRFEHHLAGGLAPLSRTEAPRPYMEVSK